MVIGHLKVKMYQKRSNFGSHLLIWSSLRPLRSIFGSFGGDPILDRLPAVCPTEMEGGIMGRKPCRKETCQPSQNRKGWNVRLLVSDDTVVSVMEQVVNASWRSNKKGEVKEK